jgi:hypothetical protein
MSESDRNDILEQISTLAGQGLRCLAIAEITGAGALSDLTVDNKH